ncbi:type IV pilin N-terminal domain-containing protein [Methanoculleus frigidifontis]|uniref:type IV pilin N-terminal domain-containing protein n=1 Tax=Methanoculleus frigidifontis TaxID=2584085 RepID=UPI00265924B6|nr:type IV pilin N-terminal domain-containing protein [Methanoculleus sp. FWC-SCC1]
MASIRAPEDAVSPVIGVILMVAITMILATVVAATTFYIGTDLEDARHVVVTAERMGTDVVFTNHGGSDIDATTLITCYVGDPSLGQSVNLDTAVGSSAINPHGQPNTQERVMVVVSFVDGRSQVVLDVQM